MTQQTQEIAIIGGGAAGFFAAITAAEAAPHARVTIYERSKQTLAKVKISGGGRCNVTHSCFDPAKLATHYPRGSRELRGAFHRWQPQDTINWFAERGVTIKREPDGRMFPTTDDSQTIIDCFHQAARNAGVQLRKECGVKSITHQSSFIIHLSDDTQVSADKVLIATGSLKASTLTRALEALGHSIEPLAPSLFAFNLADNRNLKRRSID
ncbi:MAG: aminoacetone oxidase family FAD-binding enzyme [Opitutales bacterium]|nr:aminoacetone oxidase family FAD-binding enzyme [Opitutales bacterium]